MVEQGTENPRVVGSIPTGGTTADLAHLVERDLAKVEVAGSIPVIRSNLKSEVFTSDFCFMRTKFYCDVVQIRQHKRQKMIKKEWS